MNYTLESLASDLQAQNYAVLSPDLAANGTLIAALQNSMASRHGGTDDKALGAFVDSQNFHGGRWTRFNIMVTSFLKLARDVNPWSAWDSCDVVFGFYADLSNCLLDDSYPCEPLVPLFLATTEHIIPLAVALDAHHAQLGLKRHQFLSHTSMVISKLFNSIKANSENRIDDFARLPQKQQILLYLVNRLNNIYFRMDAPQLCSNIFKNFRPKCSIPRFSLFPLRQQIEYRYLLGRYYLLNARISNAFVQLNDAFRSLIAVAKTSGSSPTLLRNVRRVLQFLVPTGILMGKMPRLSVVAEFDADLANVYSTLQQSIRAGNIQGINGWLRQHQQRLLEKNLLLVLLEKLPMVAYQHLVRRLVRDWSLANGVNRLPYDLVARALHTSIGSDDNSSTIDIFTGIHPGASAENVLVTLINLGYLRANCFPALRLCVFKKTGNLADILPPIAERIVGMFPLNSDDAWLDS
ncbi:Thp1 protein [Maudiozyma humilis]|uniref:Thp1 protein n=1 Tax=Maudiozyma humilis TaxID=51915 RepID=A0AAV5S573_MAUHU|nr:Thp1 protein [Kazachstania humilis]